jgi:archaemetzincin
MARALASLLVVVMVSPATADSETAQARAARALRALFEKRSGPPRNHEWLHSHKEPGQTFEEYRTASEYKNFGRAVLYIQPLGTFSPAQERILRDVEIALEIFYGKPVKRLEPIDLDIFFQRQNPYTRERQYSTFSILNRLEPTIPRDAQAVLAFTAADLWPGNDWNYVFGQALFERPIGVWSLYRLGVPEVDYPLTLQRALKLALHETGHMLGIKHCTAYRCGMSGTNNVVETDAAPLAFCPECDRKLWWGLKLPIAARYRALARYAKERGLTPIAKFFARAAERVR